MQHSRVFQAVHLFERCDVESVVTTRDEVLALQERGTQFTCKVVEKSCSLCPCQLTVGQHAAC